MVSTRIRRRRRSRHHRFQKAYRPFYPTFSRLRIVLLSALLIVTLHLLTKQQTSAEALTQPAALSASWVPTLAQKAIPLTQQGNQITLNGKALPVNWSQRQQQIGISDAGLIQTFGINLLSNPDVAQQPITWFSDAPAALSLPTWLTGQYRYLDITELTQRYGWQVQTHQSTLQITTPAAQVMQVRQGRQSWGDRIVIDLDKPTPWQVTEQRGEAVIAIEAQIDPATLRGFSSRPGSRLQSVKVERSGDRTLIRVAFPDELRPRVWSLTNPNRLLIDIRPDSLTEQVIHWAPGIRWQQQMVSLGRTQFPVVSLEIDPRQSGVSLKPVLSNAAAVTGTTSLTSTAQRTQAAAAINGGFFNRNTKMPLGAIRSENQWISGPILNRGAIAWNPSGEAIVGHLSLIETATLTSTATGSTTGKRFPILSLNSGFVGAGICRYTQAWGTNYTSILDNEVLITVRNQQVTDQRRAATAGKTTIPIPADGYLLVVRANAEIANALTVGTSIQIDSITQPAEFDQYSEVMGAGPLLLQNGQNVLNAESEGFSTAFVQQSAPRSVIATTTAGNLVLVAIHNRPEGRGPSLAETAQLMQQMGFVHALNLDGGSSTALYLGGQLLDRPSSTAALVHNGIGVFVRP